MAVKVCGSCNKTKILSEFHTRSKTNNKPIWACKQCIRVRDRIRYTESKRNQDCKNRASAYYYENRNKVLEQRKIYNAEHRPERAMLNAKRRARINKAMPEFANKQYMNDLYTQAKEASELFKLCGMDVQFQVDHIIPLNGDKVSGFHSEYNMQILSLRENTSKSNKFDSDLYETQWCNL